MNDTVMKAHQNRNMNYDEMHDYEMFNEAAHPARGNLLSIYGIIKDITVLMLNERKISVQIYYSSYCASPLLGLISVVRAKFRVLYSCHAS